MRSRVPALAILALVLASGCVEHARLPDASGVVRPGAGTGAGNGSAPSGAAAARTPKDVHESHEGDLEGGFGTTWSWTLERGHVDAYTVRLSLEGMHGLPQWAATDLHVVFVDAAGHEVRRTDGGGPAGVTSGGPMDLLAWSAADGSVVPAGTWKVDFGCTCAGHYMFDALARYS